MALGVPLYQDLFKRSFPCAALGANVSRGHMTARRCANVLVGSRRFKSCCIVTSSTDILGLWGLQHVLRGCCQGKNRARLLRRHHAEHL